MIIKTKNMPIVLLLPCELCTLCHSLGFLWRHVFVIYNLKKNIRSRPLCSEITFELSSFIPSSVKSIFPFHGPHFQPLIGSLVYSYKIITKLITIIKKKIKYMLYELEELQLGENCIAMNSFNHRPPMHRVLEFPDTSVNCKLYTYYYGT
jgi:hypothetical protein